MTYTEFSAYLITALMGAYWAAYLWGYYAKIIKNLGSSA